MPMFLVALLFVPATCLAQVRVCTFKAVVQMPKAGLANCAKVNLMGNAIRRLESGAVSNLPELRKLSFFYGKVEFVAPDAISNTPRLDFIDLSVNQLKQLPVFTSEFPSVREIRLVSNRLTVLPSGFFRSFPGLKSIALGMNAFSEFPSFEGLESSLEEVTLNSFFQNPIKRIASGAFSGLNVLTVVSFRRKGRPKAGAKGNRLILTSVEANSFTNLPKLRELDVSGHAIETFSATAIAASPSLRVLDVSRNRLREFQLSADDSGGFRLQRLSLAENQLAKMPKLVSTAKAALKTLDVADNRLHSIADDYFRGFSQLTVLKLSGNPLSNVNVLFGLSSSPLLTLELANASLTSLPDSLFAGFNRLARLDVHKNALVELPDLRGLENSLVEFSAKENKVARLSTDKWRFGEFTKIRQVALDRLTCRHCATVDQLLALRKKQALRNVFYACSDMPRLRVSQLQIPANCDRAVTSPSPVTERLTTTAPPGCDGRIDAAFSRYVDQMDFVFSGDAIVALSGGRIVARSALSQVLPEVTSVDAALYSPLEDVVYVFSGGSAWRFRGSEFPAGRMGAASPVATMFPTSGGREALPADLDKALTYRFKSYFFKGDRYWRISNIASSRRVDDGFPHSVSAWGQPAIESATAALTRYDDFRTYVFSADGTYSALDRSLQVAAGFPRAAASRWLKCSPTPVNP